MEGEAGDGSGLGDLEEGRSVTSGHSLMNEIGALFLCYRFHTCCCTFFCITFSYLFSHTRPVLTSLSHNFLMSFFVPSTTPFL